MIETPALLLHLDVVERNLATMAGRARQLGIGLRPHIKTHKCVELGRRQVAHGARGVTVSTLDEAEVYGRNQVGRPHFARVLCDKGYVSNLQQGAK